MRVAFLGSGSSGNATAIECDDGVVLVDAGFSARETLRRLCAAGMRTEDVRAILVTHEHTDHVSGVRVLAKRLGVPVYATAGTRAASRMDEFISDARSIRAGDTFRVSSLQVCAFNVSHDAAEPVGYRIEGSCGTVLGLVTDTGVLPADANETLAGCNVLAIECNHDEDMLRDGPYPWFLKERIRSNRGHLSNAVALDAVERMACDRLRAVVGLHLSRQNNHADIVTRGLSERMARLGLTAQVHAIAQDGINTLVFGE